MRRLVGLNELVLAALLALGLAALGGSLHALAAFCVLAVWFALRDGRVFHTELEEEA